VIEIRSYRRVFELERRIYRIDRLRLNPAGVPIRGIVYFLTLLATSLVAGALPVLASADAIAPWYVRSLALPALGAALLALIRVEGRPFHLAALALVRYRAAPRRLSGCWQRSTVGGVWAPASLPMLPDGSEERIRRLSFTGPGAALVAREHELTPLAAHRGRLRLPRGRASRAIALREVPGAAQLAEARVVVLERGTCLLTQRARGASAIGRGPRRRARASARRPARAPAPK
jgi:hypothetical protein